MVVAKVNQVLNISSRIKIFVQGLDARVMLMKNLPIVLSPEHRLSPLIISQFKYLYTYERSRIIVPFTVG